MCTSVNLDIRLDVLELVQDVFEQPDLAPELIERMDSDIQPSMTAIAAAIQIGDASAANDALSALCAVLEG